MNNSSHAALEAALRLAGRDAGFEALTLADWAALREAARRDMGVETGEEGEEAEADARFVARTFGVAKRGGRGRGLAAVLGLGGGGGEAGGGSRREEAPLMRSVPYDDFVRAVRSPGTFIASLSLF